MGRGPTGDVPRHFHREGYANVVLSGGFTQLSFSGRHRVAPGSALLHAAFDAHANVQGSSRGSVILRLPWLNRTIEGAYAVRDPDLLARLAERDPIEASIALNGMLEPVASPEQGWEDALTTALSRSAPFRLRDWAEKRSINPAVLSRGFRSVYGTLPQRFRLEARTRWAWARLTAEPTDLTTIAHDCSFADLAHMSRSVRALTGANPLVWRKRIEHAPRT